MIAHVRGRLATKSADRVVVETAGGAQATAAAALLRTADFAQVAVRADLAGVDRFVAGRA